ncbi:hypothetical protein KUTeg_002091 [Tegillarca granosa]|uniref:Vitellogenin domain-containing protein n=1 Tax=Tegillarca granosa TaxID=220873 RepID=A0ABQ9FTC7_TEGGR|nr:hypothetical protein KUTeg_002091 [Tegillarca granosa]
MDWSVFRLSSFILVFVAVTIETKYIHFKEGYEYQYNFVSDAEIKNVGKFRIGAKISYTNIRTTDEGQELLLRIYAFHFAPINDPDIKGHDWDLSKWFSFVITSHGEILQVYHPAEDGSVLATKKGFAALLASRLHDETEVEGRFHQGGWHYSVEELGHEGLHNATYTVTPTNEGKAFKKVRHEHPVKNAKFNYEKTMHFHDELGTIHKVLIEEDFTAPMTTQQGFDPHYGMRKVKPVNEFSTMAYPEMSAISKGQLHFLTRVSAKYYIKPTDDMLTSSIHVDNVKPYRRKYKNIKQARKEIYGNLTCMFNQPEKGSPDLNKCFSDIVEILKSLTDEQQTEIAEYYFVRLRPVLTRNRADTEAILDAFGILNTNHSQFLLNKLILLNPKPDVVLIQRLLFHIVAADTIPYEPMLITLEDICFNSNKFPKQMFQNDTYYRALLTLGSVAGKLDQAGYKKRALWITNNVHNMLGMHDPWKYRKKREVMTEKEMLLYDLHRVVLLETLGNAKLDVSYDYIISHINSTNSPWIKRAGVHALRGYKHQQAADDMLYSALYDEDENVRYEALLLYQAHPKSRMITPLNNKFSTKDNKTSVIDPYSSGITDVDFHHIQRRSVWKGLEFRLQSPSVDWLKMIGSTTVGASFGIIMANLLDFKIAPLSGHLRIVVHDEAFARVHLGFMGINLDFFVGQTLL